MHSVSFSALQNTRRSFLVQSGLETVFGMLTFRQYSLPASLPSTGRPAVGGGRAAGAADAADDAADAADAAPVATDGCNVVSGTAVDAGGFNVLRAGGFGGVVSPSRMNVRADSFASTPPMVRVPPALTPSTPSWQQTAQHSLPSLTLS